MSPLVLRAQTLWDELSRHNEDDPILSALVSLTSARLTPHFSPTSPTAPNSGNSTLKARAPGIMARWPEIRVPDNYIGLFETDSGFAQRTGD